MDPDIPKYAMDAIAYGDLVSAVLAVAATIFLRYRWRGALAVAWIVNAVASLDWLHASFLAASNHFATYRLGGNWYIVAYYVPAIGVAHVVIFARLLRRGPSRLGAVREPHARPTRCSASGGQVQSQPMASLLSTNHFVGKTAGPSMASLPAPGNSAGMRNANRRTPAEP